jgi:hypothetical protein
MDFFSFVLRTPQLPSVELFATIKILWVQNFIRVLWMQSFERKKMKTNMENWFVLEMRYKKLVVKDESIWNEVKEMGR